MKKIKIFLCSVLIGSATLVSSCAGFLDESPKDFRDSEGVYKDEASAHAGLLGVYQAFSELYIDPVTGFIGELGTDEVLCATNNKKAFPIHAYTLSANDLDVLPNWYKYHYYAIYLSNVLIDRAPTIQPQTAAIQRMIAEAKAIRAFCYFRLAQTFGPVPLIVKETSTPIDYSVPRAPLKDVYAQIITDLKEATAPGILLTTRDASSPIRLNYWAVKTMLGKVYLTMASHKESGKVDDLMRSIQKEAYGYAAIPNSVQELYALAETELKDIKDNSGILLESDYRKLFVVENKNKFAENMWEIQSNDGKTTANPGRGLKFLFEYGVSQTAQSRTVVLNSVFNGNIKYRPTMFISGSYSIGGSPQFIGGFVETDVRKGWCLNGGFKQTTSKNPNTAEYVPQYWRIRYNAGKIDLPAEGAGYSLERQRNDWAINGFYQYITKYRFWLDEGGAEFGLTRPTDFTDITSLPLNFTVIRYSDVLLSLAEASYKANGAATPLTVECLDMVRDRARQSTQGDGNLPKFEMTTVNMDTILNERKLELCFEGYRWFDLVRMGQLREKYNLMIPDKGQNIIAHDPMTDDKFYLYPIPASQIDASLNKEGFFQNPRY